MAPTRPSAAPAADRGVDRARTGAGGGRLATVIADFLLDPDERLTEQERALMTGMVLRLVGTLADEIRVRLPDAVARACECPAEEIVAELRRSGLLRNEAMVVLLLRRADEALCLEASGNGPSPLQGWTADSVPSVASAAMAVVLARAASRDRFGQPGLEVQDCGAETAVALGYAVAAALARRSGAHREEIVAAAVDLLGRHDEGQSLHSLEARLIASLHAAERIDAATLDALAGSGEVGLLAQALGRLGGIVGDAAWELLFSRRAGDPALLLRIADQPRAGAARLLALLGTLLGWLDPAEEITRFDRLTPSEVSDRRAHLRLPPAFGAAMNLLDHD